jgi:anti-anti-sigma factor
MSEPQLQVHHEEIEPGVVVITLAGKLLLGGEGESVEQLVADSLNRGVRGIIFDIAGLTRVDSTGIGRFIASYNKIAEAGAQMGIAAPTPHLRDCFHATQLDRVFRFFGDVPAARAALVPAEGKGA